MNHVSLFTVNCQLIICIFKMLKIQLSNSFNWPVKSSKNKTIYSIILKFILWPVCVWLTLKQLISRGLKYPKIIFMLLLFRQIQNSLSVINLVLNVQKTVFMLFSVSKYVINYNIFSIHGYASNKICYSKTCKIIK